MNVGFCLPWSVKLKSSHSQNCDTCLLLLNLTQLSALGYDICHSSVTNSMSQYSVTNGMPHYRHHWGTESQCQAHIPASLFSDRDGPSAQVHHQNTSIKTEDYVGLTPLYLHVNLWILKNTLYVLYKSVSPWPQTRTSRPSRSRRWSFSSNPHKFDHWSPFL